MSVPRYRKVPVPNLNLYYRFLVDSPDSVQIFQITGKIDTWSSLERREIHLTRVSQATPDFQNINLI